MFLIDTNVISEARKGRRANHGVREFLEQSAADGHALFLSVITIGELRRGVEQIRRRGDEQQAVVLEEWLTDLLAEYRGHVLPVDDEIAQVWGRLRLPDAGNALDKLIGATALIHDLSVVTRNTKDFEATGARILDPFSRM